MKFELPEAVKPFFTAGTLLRVKQEFVVTTAGGSAFTEVGSLFMVRHAQFKPDLGHAIFVLLTRELVEANVTIHVEKLPKYLSVVES